RGGDKPPEACTWMTTVVALAPCPICRGRLTSHEPYPEHLVCGTCGREFPRSQIRAIETAPDLEKVTYMAALDVIADPSVELSVEAVEQKPKQRRVYEPKRCACGATFTPTGPRDVRCPPCKAVRGV